MGTAPDQRAALPPPAAASGSLPRTPTLKPGAEKYRVVRGARRHRPLLELYTTGVPQTFMVPYYVQFDAGAEALESSFTSILHLSRTITL
jgi:hypothetical protein